jgi:exodeoxyribonuclease III
MKIATFNINNINRRLPNLLRWLRAAKPDVVALQELKSTDADFPIHAIDKAGYGAVWRGQKTWNGVAILARNTDPVLTRTELPGDRDDGEARYIEAAIGGIIVTSLYLPNGNPQPGPKFDYKLSNGSGDCVCTPRNSLNRTFPWCWRATTTSHRPNRISIRRNRGTRMR